MDHYLVVGSTGHVGSRLVRRLLSDGHSVRGTVHTPGSESALVALGMEARVADVERPETLTGLGEGIDYVLDLHGGRRTSHEDAWRMNVDGTRNLVEALRESPIKKYVRTNTNSLYGDRGEEWVTEETPPQAHTPVGEISAATAELLRRAYEEHGFPAVELRVPAILNVGRGQLDEARKGNYVMLGNGTSWKCHIFVDDLIEAVILAAERGTPGAAYNICTEPIRALDYYRGFAEVVGGPEPVVGQTGGQHGYAALQALANQSLRLSNEKARRELGWVPRCPTSVDAVSALATAERGATG
jgi:nucleoside-diphosphate-sugar epimerase